MHDLTNFGLSDVVESAAALRKTAEGASTMEEAAQHVVTYLYETLGDGRGDRAAALVRFFKTHPFGGLQPDQQEFARQIAGDGGLTQDTRCLTLLATRGDESDWNSRSKSRGHLAIPLTSERMVENAPMISQLITQLGLPIGAVLRPDPQMIVDLAQKTYSVFHVPEAPGSPFIPAQQEFVLPYKIRSVLGFGGVLPSGNLFATILFSKTPIGRETADMFANVALGVKLALLRFESGAIFSPAPA